MLAISVVLISLSRPWSATKASLNSARSFFSPRQCSGPKCLGMPKRVCVVIGPFIGCQEVQPGTWQLSSKSCTVPTGLPRSHDMRSERPSMWHEAQLACPRPEVRCVSKMNLRPSLTTVGVESCSVMRAISLLVPVLMVETELSKRLST